MIRGKQNQRNNCSDNQNFWKMMEEDIDIMEKKAKQNVHQYRKNQYHFLTTKKINPTDKIRTLNLSQGVHYYREKK